MIGWLFAVLALFLAYMLADSFLAEYHSFKMMEHARYMAWIEKEGKSDDGV